MVIREERYSMIFLEYSKCSTCKKAKEFLIKNNIDFEDRNIVENNPTYEELKRWTNESGRDIKTFFNTSGNLYKELNLKDKLIEMSDEEKIKLLASNGMLVKRPMLISDSFILSGFKEDLWKKIL